jgi:hypothetical protein
VIGGVACSVRRPYFGFPAPTANSLSTAGPARRDAHTDDLVRHPDLCRYRTRSCSRSAARTAFLTTRYSTENTRAHAATQNSANIASMSEVASATILRPIRSVELWMPVRRDGFRHVPGASPSPTGRRRAQKYDCRAAETRVPVAGNDAPASRHARVGPRGPRHPARAKPAR